MDDVVKTIYRCTGCGETDSDAGNNPPAPAALVCWNCKAGSRMEITQQIRAGVGMLPVSLAA